MSKASEMRVRRKRLVRDMTLKCGDCGAIIEPSLVQEPLPDVTVYWGQCRCGAAVTGMLGTPEACLQFEAFHAGFAAARGLSAPVSELRPLPRGWHDGETH
jgi:hypothetical protein